MDSPGSCCGLLPRIVVWLGIFGVLGLEADRVPAFGTSLHNMGGTILFNFMCLGGMAESPGKRVVITKLPSAVVVVMMMPMHLLIFVRMYSRF